MRRIIVPLILALVLAKREPSHDRTVRNTALSHQTCTKSLLMTHITTVTHHDSPGSGGAPASPDKPPASRRGLQHIGAMLAGSIVLATLLLVLANLAFAQSAQKKKAPSTLKPFLVEDIYPGKTGSEPNYLVDFKGKLLFAANHPKFGEELWSSDGTKPGTKLVKDIDPGPLVVNEAQNTETGSSAPDKVLLTKKGIYFAAITAKYGDELWKSDGTNRGTKIVKDIVPGTGDSGPEGFVSTAPGTTLFRAWDKKHGEELWKTDGTAKGTTLVKDINPDLPPGARCDQGDCGIPKGWSHPDTPTAMGNTLFFAADDGKHGVELWKSDGTNRGTKLVKDINTVKGNSNPNDKGDALTRSAEVEKLYVVGKTLYFRANDGKHGVELWKTDGTNKGTKLVKNINPAAPAPTTTACKREKSCAGSSWVDDMMLVGKTLYFTAKDGKHGLELWKSDGTNRGTKLVKNINTSSASEASDIGQLVAMGKTLYFTANDGKHGLELWKSDGTVKGTRLVKDIKPGKIGSDADSLTAFGGVLLFAAADGKHGPELWGSDGTWAGTILLRDLAPGAIGSEPGEFTISGRFLYFAASNPSAGEELWAVQSKGISG
jgi:ELWxxDGT repeat protein